MLYKIHFYPQNKQMTIKTLVEQNYSNRRNVHSKYKTCLGNSQNIDQNQD